ncbi:MAG: hypothetical protein BWZ10_02649 [candidate division BRC1 bacterium ADurb.BinA364]|nr:MAG: hypothetical protein BWZ10_02649 [candidate division BRC1 bacterium ADurb.BinA364]
MTMQRRAHAGLALALALALASCGKPAEEAAGPPEAAVSAGEESGLVVEGFEAPVYGDTGLRQIMRAEKAIMADAQDKARLLNVRVMQYDKSDQRIVGQVSADEGLYYIKSVPEEQREEDDVVLSGNVVVEGQNGLRLTNSRSLLYRASLGELFSNHETSIKVNDPTYKADGVGQRFYMWAPDGVENARIQLSGRGDAQARVKLIKQPEAISATSQE